MNKKVILSLSVFLFVSYEVAFAQATESPVSSGNDIISEIKGALLGLALLWMIGHMIYVLFIRKNPLTTISIDEMRAQRRESGLSEEMTEQEMQDCIRIHDENFCTWTPIPNDPKERRIITNKKMLDNATEAMLKVIAIKPTDPELVDALNANIDVIQESSKRQFTGSKVMLVLLALFLCFMFYAVGWKALPFFIFSGVLYYLASLTPNFMLYNRELKGKSGSGALGWVLGLLSGMILGAKTIRTTTYWSDGTKTTEDDNSQHQMAWFISLFVTLLLVVFLFVWAAVNYLRNYVFYR